MNLLLLGKASNVVKNGNQLAFCLVSVEFKSGFPQVDSNRFHKPGQDFYSISHVAWGGDVQQDFFNVLIILHTK